MGTGTQDPKMQPPRASWPWSIAVGSVALIVVAGTSLLTGTMAAGQDAPEQPSPTSAFATDPQIELVEVEFPVWRLIFEGEVDGTPEAPELGADQIHRLQLVFRPLLRETEHRSRGIATSVVWAEASSDGHVLGTAPHAYELMETSRGDRVPSLLGSIENLRELPEAFALVHRDRGELLRVERSPRPPRVELTRMDFRDGTVELAWAEPESGRSPRYEVFLSSDHFETYKRVHPEFYGEGEEEATRRTSFTFDLDRHYLAGEEFHLLVLANEGLQTAWQAVRVRPGSRLDYDFRANILDPEDGRQLWQGGSLRLAGSMDARLAEAEREDGDHRHRYEAVPAVLEWSSNRDGTIVRYHTDGSIFRVNCMARGLSPGRHRLTLRTETAEGATAHASVVVRVERDGDPPAERDFDCRVPQAFRIDMER